MKIMHWITKNLLFVFTLFLLAFIPLYPKLPLLDIKNTWVYVRLEDFLIAFAVASFGILWLFKKATIKLPVTIPIFLFWAGGFISTVLGIIFILPSIQGSAANVAVLSFLRRIEYLSVIFVAYNAFVSSEEIGIQIGTNSKKILVSILGILGILSGYLFLNNPLLSQFPLFSANIWIAIVVFLLCSSITGIGILFSKTRTSAAVFVLFTSLVLVVLYGLGERYFGLPAYLTMNEEFAKGIPLRLSALSRIPSTFAGHYDLAAYLVLTISIVASMIFGYKKWYTKIFLFIAVIGGLVLLLMTASRVSFSVYLLSISFMLVLQRKKWLIIPVVILSILFSTLFSGITQRFNSTISSVDLVVDARTGKAVGITKGDNNGKPLLVEEKQSTGESLPQGTGYIKLPSTAVKQATTKVIYKRTKIQAGTESAQVTNLEGDFVVKKVLAYDVSFTTRFQGEWPRAMQAFLRDVAFGSGYSSISLASDNNYIRILGETGSIGFVTFALIFLIISIYTYRVLPDVKSPIVKSFVIGVLAGTFGLALNAILIDVFEASKVAYVWWLLLGTILGVLHLYQEKKVDYIADLKTVLTSIPAIITYLLVFSLVIFSPSYGNYFVSDDFTWLRFASDCKKIIGSDGLAKCQSTAATLLGFFTKVDGIFYNPGTKIYFFFMNAIFGLNQSAYHVASILVHFGVGSLIFLLSLKLSKSKLCALLAAGAFIVLSVNAQTIYWASSIGYMLVAFSMLCSLYLYILWTDKRKWWYLALSYIGIILGLLFNEIGILTPLIFVAYIIFWRKWRNKTVATASLVSLLFIPAYMLLLYVIQMMNSSSVFLFSPSIGNYLYLLSIFLVMIVGLGICSLIFSMKRNIQYPLMGIVTILCIVFSYFQYMQLLQINKDWNKAGTITNNLLVSLNSVYQNAKITPVDPVFYFVNVPQKVGTAMVLPHGLSDALWLTFQDTNLTVHQVPNVQVALDASVASDSARIFEFDNEGNVEEIQKTLVPVK